MKKRILSSLLTAVLLLGMACSALAAETTVSVEEAAQVLAALDVMTGNGNGDLQLSRPITRAELTKLAVNASVYKDSVGDTAGVKPYPDVPKGEWYAPYIELGRDKGLVVGNSHGNFEPERNILLKEAVTLALRLLGYQNGDFSGTWPSGQMALYRTLKLDRGVSAGQDDVVTRQDAMYLFYNLLTAKNKTGQVYLTTLGHSLTASGEIDRVALINAAMEGPIIAEGDWQTAIPFALDGYAKIYRNGVLTALTSIRDQDVLYYSKAMRSLWAWTDKVTGTYTAATPSASAPGAVTVGGKSYTIETPAAAYDLSDLGTFRTGDVVTLLLGRNGGVAAVRIPGERRTVAYGVVAAVITDTYQDANGSTFTDDAVAVIGTDGVTRNYRADGKNLKAGDLVQVAVAGEGYQVKRLSKSALAGKVNGDGTAVGSTPIAADVQILDTYGTTAAAAVYPARLAGVRLQEDMVRWYALNERGEVDYLILNDVTGDLHQYGVLTEVTEKSGSSPLGGFTVSATYVYEVGGAVKTHSSTKTIWNLEKGPCQIKSDGMSVERIYNLTQAALTGVDGNLALAGSRKYTIAEGAAVYEVRDGKYYLSNLDRVAAGGYTLTGWYDKADTAGGRIRVITAKAD